MSLQEEIDAVVKQFTDNTNPEVVETLGEFIQALCESDANSSILLPGQKAPDFLLPNATGQSVRLYDVLQTGPTVLNFYRGGWCPFCSIELGAYQKILPEIKAAGASLIGISPETPDTSLSTKEKNNLQFEVLSDQGNQVAKTYGLKFSLQPVIQEIYTSFGFVLPNFNGDNTWSLPIPATYVIGQDGNIAWGVANPNYLQRPDPQEVLNAVKTLSNPVALS